MKITAETATTLIVSTGSRSILIIPIVFILVGIVLIPQLNIVPDIPLYWSLIFGGIGMLALFFGKVSTLTFDKLNHTMTIKSTGIFGSQVKKESLVGAQSIDIIESYGNQSTTDRTSTPTRNFQVLLKRADGSTIFLGSGSESVGISVGGMQIGSIAKPAIITTAQHIAQFLTIPCNTNTPLTIGNAVETIKNLVTKPVDH